MDEAALSLETQRNFSKGGHDELKDTLAINKMDRDWYLRREKLASNVSASEKFYPIVKNATKSKCCRKCRKRRERKLLRRLQQQRRSLSRSSRSLSRSSSRDSDWWNRFRGSRSPSIPIDPFRTSPSHLELRRITSARKLPVPYERKWTSSDDSDDSYFSYKRNRRRKRSRRR